MSNDISERAARKEFQNRELAELLALSKEAPAAALAEAFKRGFAAGERHAFEGLMKANEAALSAAALARAKAQGGKQ